MLGSLGLRRLARLRGPGARRVWREAAARAAHGDSKPVPLAYDVVVAAASGEGAARPPVVFLHGLFGSRANFTSLSRALAQRTGRTMVTVDARNHGDSAHAPTMSYMEQSLDVRALLTGEGGPPPVRVGATGGGRGAGGDQREASGPLPPLGPVVLVGHSMGGKVAMATALQWPELVAGLVVLDVAPGLTRGFTPFRDFIGAMERVSFAGAQGTRSQARALVDSQLAPRIPDSTIRQFLLTNVTERRAADGGARFGWRVNLEAIVRHIDCLFDFPRPAEGASYSGPTLFIGGGDSPYISPEDLPVIARLFPGARVSHIPGAGHWVHAERPAQVVAALSAFLQPSRLSLWG